MAKKKGITITIEIIVIVIRNALQFNHNFHFFPRSMQYFAHFWTCMILCGFDSIVWSASVHPVRIPVIV